MNADGRFPGYAEIWDNANRVCAVHLALRLALLDAALAPCRELWRPQPPLTEEDRRALNTIAKGASPEKAPAF